MFKQEIQQQLFEHLNHALNPCFIILFDSNVKGTNHHESDIDLAYFYDKTSMDNKSN